MCETHWEGWLETYPDGYGGRKGVSTGVAGKTLSDALADAFRTATYYAICCDYKTVAVERLREVCDKCLGAKQIRVKRPRSVRFVKCPDCKGVGVFHTIPDFCCPVHLNVLEDFAKAKEVANARAS